jgi:hypothetical protein
MFESFKTPRKPTSPVERRFEQRHAFNQDDPNRDSPVIPV